MPAIPSEGRTRIKIGGVWKDPAEWIHLAGRWVRRDTGAVVTSRPLAMSEPSVNGYTTGAAFRELIGVNIHFKRPGTPYDNPQNVVADLAQLGIRHVRDSLTGSFFDTTFWYWRQGFRAIHARNQALGVGEHPIFVSVLVPGHTGYQPFTHQPAQTGGAGWTVDDFIAIFTGGRQHKDGSFNLIPNGVTTQAGGNLWPNPWAIADAEIPFDLIDSIEGTNEPPSTAALGNLRAWMQEFKDKMALRTDRICGGHPIATLGGIRTDVQAKQMPIVGPSVINAGVANTLGDWTTSPPVHAGDAHPYHPGLMPSNKHFDQYVAKGAEAAWFNGGRRSPADYTKSLPAFLTEQGHISRGIHSAQQVVAASSHSGYWPAPDSVIAEYDVREAFLYSRRGVVRYYRYELYDETNNSFEHEENFGWYRNDRTLKPQGAAMRNLMSLIPFSEPSAGKRRFIPYQVLGFTPYGTDGSGINKHIAKFVGNGDPGVVQIGQSYHDNPDMIEGQQIQYTDDDFILGIIRHVEIWDREPGNYNASNQPESLANIPAGTKTPPLQNIVLNFPGGLTSASWSQPTLTGNNYEDGRTWFPLTISGGTQLHLPIQGNTKLVKFRPV